MDASPFISVKKILVLLAILYFAGASVCSWNVITHTTGSTNAIEQILLSYSMKNEGALALERYANEHPFMGMFFASPVRHELDLPSHEEAAGALGPDIRDLLKQVRLEARVAAWWSCLLLNLSLLYIVTVIALVRSVLVRPVLFALTAASLFFFLIGIFAPAIIVWTAPTIPMASGNLNFVLQHQVRGIAAIIKELITTGHWVVGGFLLLFSIVTPLTKASLTFFITGCRSHALNHRIAKVLHSIGKWSMADVFVAGVFLSLFALKAQEATKSIPCLGLYYFIGYCLFSMTTTELLTHSGLVTADKPDEPENKFGLHVVGGLVAGLLCFAATSAGFTYQQYTLNTEKKIVASPSPAKLDNADLVLPAHH